MDVGTIQTFGTFGDGDTGMAAGGGSMAASSGGATQEMSRPKWSDWKKVWKVLKKDSITGKRIRGRINERRVRVWSSGIQGEGNSGWQNMVEYASDKELFEGTLKDSIPEYYA